MAEFHVFIARVLQVLPRCLIGFCQARWMLVRGLRALASLRLNGGNSTLR